MPTRFLLVVVLTLGCGGTDGGARDAGADGLRPVSDPLPPGLTLAFSRYVQLGRVRPGSEVSVETGKLSFFLFDDGGFYLRDASDYDARLESGTLGSSDLEALLSELRAAGDLTELSGDFRGEMGDAFGLDVFQVSEMSAPMLCTILCEGTRAELVLPTLLRLLDDVVRPSAAVVAAGEFQIVAQRLNPADQPWRRGISTSPIEAPFDLSRAIRSPGGLPPFSSWRIEGGRAVEFEALLEEHDRQVEQSERSVIDRILYLYEGGADDVVYQVFFRDVFPGAEENYGTLDLEGLESPR